MAVPSGTPKHGGAVMAPIIRLPVCHVKHSLMFKPHKDSLFSILLRSPWWASLLIAVGLFFASRLFLPPVAAAASTFPWVALALYGAWRQMKVPGATRVADTLERLRGMSWEEFSALVADGFRREGYEVTMKKGGAADLELRKQGYVTLVACRRWKVAQAGIAPVRELQAVREAGEVRSGIYITAGELSPQAAAFAAEKNLSVLRDVALVTFIGRIGKARAKQQPVAK